mmetsp:Transcript_2549/g.3475  ORF Transcript_2549/g.3475 Transcript_2549/m.3475 type:complete len:254 (-) Transcript_2549:91-852(-)
MAAALVVPALVSAAVNSVPSAAYFGYRSVRGIEEKPPRIASLRFDSKKRKYYIIGTVGPEARNNNNNKKEYDFKCTSLEQAINHFSEAGFARMKDKEEKEWIELMNHQHADKPHRKVVMLFFKRWEDEKKSWWGGSKIAEEPRKKDTAKAAKNTSAKKQTKASEPVESEQKNAWWSARPEEKTSLPAELPKNNAKSKGFFGTTKATSGAASTGVSKAGQSRKSAASSKKTKSITQRKSKPSDDKKAKASRTLW